MSTTHDDLPFIFRPAVETLPPPGSSARNRYVCTAAAPWSAEKGRWSEHPDAAPAGDDIDYGGGENCARYRCPHCGTYFEVELAQ